MKPGIGLLLEWGSVPSSSALRCGPGRRGLPEGRGRTLPCAHYGGGGGRGFVLRAGADRGQYSDGGGQGKGAPSRVSPAARRLRRGRALAAPGPCGSVHTTTS